MNDSAEKAVRVLVVDDEPAILAAFGEVLRPKTASAEGAAQRMRDLERTLFGDGESETGPLVELTALNQAEPAVEAVAQAVAQGRPFAVAFVDVRMPPGPDGVWAVKEMRARDQALEIVVMTAYSDVPPGRIAQMAPPPSKLLYMQKPFHAHELRQLVASLSDKWRSQRELERTQRELERRVEERTAQLAQANASLREEIERRRANQAELARSEQNLRLILDCLPVGLMITDSAGKVLRVNAAALKLSGHAHENDLLGRHCREIIAEHEQSPWPPSAEPGPSQPCESTLMRLSGEGLPVLVSAIALKLDGQDVLLQAIADLSERKNWERALNESEARYRQLVEFAPAGIYEFDFSASRFLSVNEVMLEYTGYDRDEFLALRPEKLLTPESLRDYLGQQKQLLAGDISSQTNEYQFYTKSGRTMWALVNANFVFDGQGRLVGRVVANDITARKQAEQDKVLMESRIRQAQKMEALGSLAGGVAHDFNNILNAVIGFTELTLRELGEQETPKAYLKHVLQAGRRASELVRQILTFSRGGEPEKKPIHVAIVVKEVLKLLRASLPAGIEIKQNIQNADELVLADPSQIHQVMMNLCANAAQAMGESGLLTVELRKVTLGRPLELDMASLPPGPYVQLVVADNGPGVEPAHIGRIFEPYFSTKSASGGTGLGLAVVHGIVKGLDGAIDVKSAPGAGCQFRVFLPIPGLAADDDQETPNHLPMGHETILLVDDEPELVRLGLGVLEVLGYRVESATDPEEALRMFLAEPARYDLLLTDQTMPKMTGLELIERVRARRGGLPVVLCTGYGEQVARILAQRGENVRLAQKPVLMAELAQAVRLALDETGPERREQ
ncbi:multi-sensor hybrid histidine kinase [Desulfarculus baarsii DSM 2075]|uniref:histidine kinase n=1 Tax=Desulfarculus baarsii (strain ATCC 33931 / DSM 2075 / LMG 7858 / VKM B-1802 / 2st14) TaxID=644282 RepID=E1QL95_DESB2|nr:PAS domain S-box protein [Desulfarculus baarsii]ADK85360.1 multi-sensor hybrid histidine kinase [Desulfarculus baarsii DSM 2075]